MAVTPLSRRWRWAVLGVSGCAVPFLGLGTLVGLALVVLLMVIGGFGYHESRTPPPLPAVPVYSAQWLPLAEATAAAGGLNRLPNPLWVAAVATTSGGRPLDRTPAGGYGLVDWPSAAAMGAPQTALADLGAAIRAHWVPENLQATLNAVGLTLAPPAPGWAAAVKSAITALEAGPTIVAWPLGANWTAHGWVYPHRRILVAAVATAPVGRPYQIAWTPPVTVCAPPPPHGVGGPHCTTITDNVTGRDLMRPRVVTLHTAPGTPVPMVPAATDPKAAGLVYPGAQVYVTARPVVVSPQRPVSVTASWGPGVAVSTTLPGRGFATGAGGPVGPLPPAAANPKTLDQIWQTYGAGIRTASAATGTPASLLVSEAYWESRGEALSYAGPTKACGVWQMFSPGAFTEFAPPGTPPAACADPAIEVQAAAADFAYLYSLFGNWEIAIAAYYGGPGTVQNAHVTSGMSWAQAAPLLNFIPDPNAGNTATMTQYAAQSFATATAFAASHGLPPP
ncbi:MAG: transglycosylase SLT domain-containing protein [Firmicutes bacterium]|nr:transglycosylase SLT domain-containing protein [Bacillota bacterium]